MNTLSYRSGKSRQGRLLDLTLRKVALVFACVFVLVLAGCGNDAQTESTEYSGEVKEHPKITEARERMKKKDFDGAIANTNSILAKEQENTEAIAFMGYIFLKYDRPHDARVWSERALELDPYLALPHAVIARVKFLTRKFDTALELARKALIINPKTPLAYRVIGEVYLKRGYIEQSIQVLQQAAVYEPDNAQLLNLLSSAHLKSKNYPAALNVLLKANELNEEIPGAHLNLALTYAAMDEGMQALKHIGIAEVLYIESENKQWTAKVRDVRRNIERKFNVSAEQMMN